jgi:outer membrane protein OmpA-like peptidoglycan-associated protein
MKHKLLTISFASALICGCATSTSPQVSDNADITTFVSSEGDFASSAASDQTTEMDHERSSLMQKIQELGGELLGSKEKLSAANLSSSFDPRKKAVLNSANLASSSLSKSKVKSVKVSPKNVALAESNKASKETIVIQDSGMIFRVTHGFAKTDFLPSRSLKQQLLMAARAGKQIEIRGRTDAATANEIDKNIAMHRALNARIFLANNGIHPRKMRINYQASGDNIADNKTPDGRARNRRVEIETLGINPDVLEAMAAVIRKDLQ